ncbi:MAG: dihydroorotase family protein, partial [Deltaproteobacteria bacterium]|nr:dihydroorotase family protein [Deltaproteobacteria bacterium]
FRTGKNYLDKIGPFKEIWPELMDRSKDSFRIDYSYHLAIMTGEQMAEMPWLLDECGVPTFKYYMFYKTIDLAGDKASGGYLLSKDSLDFGFLYRLMSSVAELNDGQCGPASLSIHCENPEIIAETQEEVRSARSGNLTRDYSNMRPPWAEELAIREVGLMAKRTGCPINLLHLTSREAVDAAIWERADNPDLDFLLEATLHHLSMSYATDYGVNGKVNPPIRGPEDVDYLWEAVATGNIETVCSDHACIMSQQKQGDLWTALPGFGGTSLFFPVLLTEGHHKRGLDLARIAELTAYNPAIRYHLYPRKGDIMIGADADLAIVDIDREKEITLDLLKSAQDFSPFEGLKLKGWVETTISRGEVIYRDGRVLGQPGRGEYIKRPV